MVGLSALNEDSGMEASTLSSSSRLPSLAVSTVCTEEESPQSTAIMVNTQWIRVGVAGEMWSCGDAETDVASKMSCGFRLI